MGEQSYKKGTTVSRKGIMVHQLLTEEEFGVPSVVLKLVSNRRNPVEIRLEVPDIDAERIGFHPDFEQESWSITDGRLVFETELEPEGELTTLYAIESGDTTGIEAALESLEVTTVDPIGVPEEEIQDDFEDPLAASGEATGVAQEQGGGPANISGTAERDSETVEPIADDSTDVGQASEDDDLTAPPTDDPEKTLIDLEEDTPDEGASPVTEQDLEAEQSEGVVEFDDLSEESTSTANGDPEPTEASTMNQDDTTSDVAENRTDDSQIGTIPTNTLVEELTTRLENEDISPEQRRRLQAAGIGQAEGRDEVRDAQISHLQSRVSDIEAFTDAFEQLFQQYGAPAELFDDFENRLESMEEQLSSMNDDLEATTEQVDGVQPRLASVEEELSEMDDEVGAVSEDVETVKRNQEALQSDVRNIETWRKKVTGALEAFMGE
jgi:hypothetical protein